MAHTFSLLRWSALWRSLLLMVVMGAAASRLVWAADFLDPEKAFRISAQAQGPSEVVVRFDIAEGYYLYRDRVSIQAKMGAIGDVVLPAGKIKFDENFQKELQIWRGSVVAQVPVRGNGPLVLEVQSQGCADAGLCYPPQVTELKVGEAARPVERQATPTEQKEPADVSSASTGRAEALLASGHLLAVMGGFWLLGVLLSLTPCVLPMVPILSSIIAGEGEVGRRRGTALAVAYVLGMSLVYTAMGVAAGLAGEGLAAALQKPWVLGLFAALLAGLSLSMFDVYELRLPLALSGQLEGWSRRLPGGRFVGVFLMGALSALIVSPCVTAPLASTLLFISQTGQAGRGGLALFAMAWGMGMPLLLVGLSAGRWLPRSGAWMHAVKHFFGLLLLAVALWIVQPVLPGSWPLLAWAAWLLVLGFMLRPFDAHPHSHAPRVWLQRATGLAALVCGGLQLVGAAAGAKDALQPLAPLIRSVGSETAGVPSAVTEGLPFQTVRSVQELETVLSQTTQPVMLDFYADWCVSCKEMERFTFSDPTIQQRLAHAKLLKADVTANTPDDKALLQRFRLFGPPGTIFFDAKGQEMPQVRVMGFQSAADFSKTLSAAGL